MVMADVVSNSWWQRNWKWMLPLGGLVMLAFLVACATVFLALVFGMMKQADVFGMAMDQARSHREVAAALGEPIQDRWYLMGNITINGPTGDAAMSIPISGPKGDATIHFEARKSAGAWRFTELVVELDTDGRRIDLLHDPMREDDPGDAAIPALER